MVSPSASLTVDTSLLGLSVAAMPRVRPTRVLPELSLHRRKGRVEARASTGASTPPATSPRQYLVPWRGFIREQEREFCFRVKAALLLFAQSRSLYSFRPTASRAASGVA